MTVSMQELYQEERLFDEHSLGSMQPSDELGDDYVAQYEDVPDDERSFDRSNRQPTPHEEALDHLKESFFANKIAIVDYFAELVPTFSVEGSKVTDAFSQFDASKQDTATYSKLYDSRPEVKAKRTGSTHSRCIIENTESIQERQDEELRRSVEGDEDDDARDQVSTMSSVEFSQISELTMDMPTVVTEQRFAQCSALPTISEVKELHTPQLAATCTSGVVKGKARCAAVTDTTTNQNEGNHDFLDFVFELVEDAVCKPLKTSKSERKKVFMEAFHEESEKILKLASKNGAKDPFRETSRHSRRSSSKHSRSSTGTKRSTPKPKNSEYPMDEEEDEESMLNPVDNSIRSSRKSDHSRMKIVDKPPLQPPGFNSAYPLNEELTIDWSKMMSLAEKQMEAEEGKSVASNNSRVSEVSGITENPSMFQSVQCEEADNNDESVLSDESPTKVNPGAHSVFKSSELSTVSTSVSTHSALNKNPFIKDLRELSALDSSSFEEESRFILTTSLFRYMKSFVPSLSDLRKKKNKKMEFEDRAFDEVSVASIPSIKSMDDEEFEFEHGDNRDEETMLRVMHYIAFFYAFVFWPAGVARKDISRKNKQKSLLQLVNER